MDIKKKRCATCEYCRSRRKLKREAFIGYTLENANSDGQFEKDPKRKQGPKAISIPDLSPKKSSRE